MTEDDYQSLLAFRTRLRQFLHWSQAQARAAGLTAAQHQLLLAVKGHPGPREPTVGDLAGYLLLRPHSTGELIDRAAAAGLVRRCGDEQDGRRTRIALTSDGESRLAALAMTHLRELRELAPLLGQLAAGPQPAAGPDS
jgi:DNA-binding MarR family transcriptional regulator